MSRMMSEMPAFVQRYSESVSKFNRFFYSDIYFLLLLVISFTCWYFNVPIVGMALLCAVALVVFATSRDVAPILPIMPLMLMVVAKDTFLKTESNVVGVAIVGTIFAVGLIFNIIFFRQRLRKGRLTIPFIAISLALFLGGIGSPYMAKYMDGMVFILSLGPLMLGLYIYSMSCIDIPREVDSRMYFAKIATLIALICALQVLVSHLRLGGELIDHFRAVLSVGWSNRAGLVIMLTLGLSSAFYMADNAKHGNFILYHFALAIYLALMFTCGRGGMIFGTIEMIMIAIYLLAKGNHRRQFALALSMWALGVILTIVIGRETFLELMEKFKQLGLNSSGRTSLFKEGFEQFLMYPIFGVGFGFRGKHYFDESCIYWFHSTPIQVIASMGLVGAVCYLYYYIERVRVLFERINPFNIMMIFALICFEVHSLIDAGTFEPLPFLFTAVLLNTFVEYVNREDDERAEEELLADVRRDVSELNAMHKSE